MSTTFCLPCVSYSSFPSICLLPVTIRAPWLFKALAIPPYCFARSALCFQQPPNGTRIPCLSRSPSSSTGSAWRIGPPRARPGPSIQPRTRQQHCCQPGALMAAPRGSRRKTPSVASAFAAVKGVFARLEEIRRNSSPARPTALRPPNSRRCLATAPHRPFAPLTPLAPCFLTEPTRRLVRILIRSNPPFVSTLVFVDGRCIPPRRLSIGRFWGGGWLINISVSEKGTSRFYLMLSTPKVGKARDGGGRRRLRLVADARAHRDRGSLPLGLGWRRTSLFCQIT